MYIQLKTLTVNKVLVDFSNSNTLHTALCTRNWTPIPNRNRRIDRCHTKWPHM